MINHVFPRERARARKRKRTRARKRERTRARKRKRTRARKRERTRARKRQFYPLDSTKSLKSLEVFGPLGLISFRGRERLKRGQGLMKVVGGALVPGEK